MYTRFAIFIVSLILSHLPYICCASFNNFESSDNRVYKRKISDFNLDPKDGSSKKSKLAYEQASIDSLPAEILVNIFSEVFLYDVINCSQVCRMWYGAYRLLLTSSHVPLFCRSLLGQHEHFEQDEKISMSEQEFAVNHLLLDYRILFEIQDHKTHNISEPIYNSPNVNNVSEKIANIILTHQGSPFCIGGVDQHYSLIQQWYQKIPAKFDIIVNMNIGYMYEYGKGIKQDFGTACEWYERACHTSKENGRTYLPLIYYRLGRIYENWSHKRNVELLNDDGPNANDDILNAKHYYQKAASQNYTSAQYRLNLLKTCE